MPEFAIDRLTSPQGPVVLHLRGVLDYSSAPRLRSCLSEYPDTPLVIELRGLELLDSSGLAALLAAARGGARVRGAEGRVRRLLERTRTLEILAGE
jgi:anti-anti-sigma factor